MGDKKKDVARITLQTSAKMKLRLRRMALQKNTAEVPFTMSDLIREIVEGSDIYQAEVKREYKIEKETEEANSSR